MHKVIDAYRYFFPVGWLLGLWGVALWVVFPLGWVSYPGLHHPEIMLGGFFLCFVCGFLMTAAPKFTSSFEPTLVEQRGAFGLIALMLSAITVYSKFYFYFAVSVVFIFLLVFLLRRFKARKSNPPEAFIFVGVGVLLGLAGSLIQLISTVSEVSEFLFKFSRLLFLQAYVLCLVLGVGSRLIPALLGWSSSPHEGASTSSVKNQRGLILALALVFVGSYILEALDFYLTSQLTRALVYMFIFFKFWNIHRFPQRRGYQGWALWLAAWNVLLGQLAMVLFRAYRVHILHVTLISGLALMTFMIASRVALAHGKHEMILEDKSKALLFGAVLIGLAGVTRLSASFAPHIYQTHLLYAAITWILGLLIWGWVFLPRIVCINKPSNRP